MLRETVPGLECSSLVQHISPFRTSRHDALNITRASGKFTEAPNKPTVVEVWVSFLRTSQAQETHLNDRDARSSLFGGRSVGGCTRPIRGEPCRPACTYPPGITCKYSLTFPCLQTCGQPLDVQRHKQKQIRTINDLNRGAELTLENVVPLYAPLLTSARKFETVWGSSLP